MAKPSVSQALREEDLDLRVLIVADDPLVRSGLAALLADKPGCEVVGQVAGEVDLDQMISIYQPDVVVWDLGWEPARQTPGSGRVEFMPELEGVKTPVVILLPDEIYAIDAWQTGVQGLLLRETGADTLVSALYAATQGLIVLDPALAGAALRDRAEPSGQLAEELTPRELEVLQLLAEGLPNKTIAHQLGISDHTVKFHVNAILGKLRAQSRTEAVVQATRLGLIIL